MFRYADTLSWNRTHEHWVAAPIEVLAVAGAVAVGAWVRIPLPFTPAPITLQTLPVLVAAYAVGRDRATAGILLYLVLGLAGAPLFAAPFGPTFGYLAAFALVPWVMARCQRPLRGILVATLLIYAMGTAWLCMWLQCSAWAGLAMAVLPFLPGDALKAGAAYLIIRRRSELGRLS